MVGNITDLLGELYYLYVDDASKTGGITREEASHINQMLVTDDLDCIDDVVDHNVAARARLGSDDEVGSFGYHYVCRLLVLFRLFEE